MGVGMSGLCTLQLHHYQEENVSTEYLHVRFFFLKCHCARITEITHQTSITCVRREKVRNRHFRNIIFFFYPFLFLFLYRVGWWVHLAFM
jgi:hypothetical protein